MKLRYKFAQKFFLLIMKSFWNLKTKGIEQINQKEGVIVCSNHNYFLDPPFLGSVVPFESYFIAKSELFKNKIFAKIISLFNAIPVKRDRFSGSTIKMGESLIRNKKNLIIFPEGSRKSFRAKPGIARIAVSTRAMIYPVKILNIKNFKECFLRKKHLTFVFKKPLKPGWHKKFTDGKPDYRKLAAIILDRINADE